MRLGAPHVNVWRVFCLIGVIFNTKHVYLYEIDKNLNPLDVDCAHPFERWAKHPGNNL
jgi:hypothetical protein